VHKKEKKQRLPAFRTRATIRTKVKETLLIPVRYLLTFLIVALIASLGIYIFSWGENFALGESAAWHLEVLLRAGYSALLPTSLLSLVITILILRNRRGHPLFHFLALWISFSFFYLAALTILAPYSPLTPGSRLSIELPQAIHDYNDGAVYIEKIPAAGSGAVLLRPDETPRMSAGIVESDSAGLLRIAGDELLQEPRNPFFEGHLTPPRSLRRIFTDFRIITSSFAYLSSASPSRLMLTIGAFGLMMTAAWIFGRFTTWPLLNTVFLLFILRVLIFLLALSLGPEAGELLQSFLPGTEIMDLLPPFFATAAAVLIIWDLLFVPYRRESGGGKSG
jgi:hypothetical protein